MESKFPTDMVLSNFIPDPFKFTIRPVPSSYVVECPRALARTCRLALARYISVFSRPTPPTKCNTSARHRFGPISVM